MAIMSLALSVFDHYSLRLSADQAFKGSLVMVRLYGWLDARKKCCRSTPNAGWRKVARPRCIIEMRFMHASFQTRFKRERLVGSQPPTPG